MSVRPVLGLSRAKRWLVLLVRVVFFAHRELSCVFDRIPENGVIRDGSSPRGMNARLSAFKYRLLGNVDSNRLRNHPRLDYAKGAGLRWRFNARSGARVGRLFAARTTTHSRKKTPARREYIPCSRASKWWCPQLTARVLTPATLTFSFPPI